MDGYGKLLCDLGNCCAGNCLFLVRFGLFDFEKPSGKVETAFLAFIFLCKLFYYFNNRGVAEMKNRLREEILQKRKELSEEERRQKSARITATLRDSERYKKAETIFTFISMDKEVNTYPLIEQAWKDGKKVAVPIAKAKGEMYFVPIDSFSELKKSRFGVMEPEKEKEESVIPKETDVFLVPGSVFDQKGNRYGYGGGFYDRFFEKYPSIFKIAVAFSFQVMDFDLQVEAFDKPVDCIITEDSLIGGF